MHLLGRSALFLNGLSTIRSQIGNETMSIFTHGMPDITLTMTNLLSELSDKIKPPIIFLINSYANDFNCITTLPYTIYIHFNKLYHNHLSERISSIAIAAYWFQYGTMTHLG